MSVLGEHDRLLGNVVLMGIVAEIDAEQARVRVDADGLRTAWLPWAERRTGPGVRTWCAPEVGEQVVLVCPYGDPAQAVVVGSIYRDAYPAPANAATLHRTIYADGSRVEYDRAAHALTVFVGEGTVTVHCKTATVTASESVTLDAPTVRATGDVAIDGRLTAQGEIATPSEVKAGDIGLKAHHHTAQGSNAPTTTAQL